MYWSMAPAFLRDFSSGITSDTETAYKSCHPSRTALKPRKTRSRCDPSKGTLLPGADADVTIYDPAEHYTLTPDVLHSLAGYTPFDSFPLQGRVKMTLSRGQVVYEHSEFTGRPGQGRFVAGRPFAIGPHGAQQHVNK